MSPKTLKYLSNSKFSSSLHALSARSFITLLALVALVTGCTSEAAKDGGDVDADTTAMTPKVNVQDLKEQRNFAANEKAEERAGNERITAANNAKEITIAQLEAEQEAESFLKGKAADAEVAKIEGGTERAVAKINKDGIVDKAVEPLVEGTFDYLAAGKEADGNVEAAKQREKARAMQEALAKAERDLRQSNQDFRRQKNNFLDQLDKRTEAGKKALDLHKKAIAYAEWESRTAEVQKPAGNCSSIPSAVPTDHDRACAAYREYIAEKEKLRTAVGQGTSADLAIQRARGLVTGDEQTLASATSAIDAAYDGHEHNSEVIQDIRGKVSDIPDGPNANQQMQEVFTSTKALDDPNKAIKDIFSKAKPIPESIAPKAPPPPSQVEEPVVPPPSGDARREAPIPTYMCDGQTVVREDGTTETRECRGQKIGEEDRVTFLDGIRKDLASIAKMPVGPERVTARNQINSKLEKLQKFGMALTEPVSKQIALNTFNVFNNALVEIDKARNENKDDLLNNLNLGSDLKTFFEIYSSPDKVELKKVGAGTTPVTLRREGSNERTLQDVGKILDSNREPAEEESVAYWNADANELGGEGGAKPEPESFASRDLPGDVNALDLLNNGQPPVPNSDLPWL